MPRHQGKLWGTSVSWFQVLPGVEVAGNSPGSATGGNADICTLREGRCKRGDFTGGPSVDFALRTTGLPSSGCNPGGKLLSLQLEGDLRACLQSLKD